eukprot:scaffold264147_cov30-Tisochrysis_lutea.AAC.4
MPMSAVASEPSVTDATELLAALECFAPSTPMLARAAGPLNQDRQATSNVCRQSKTRVNLLRSSSNCVDPVDSCGAPSWQHSSLLMGWSPPTRANNRSDAPVVPTGPHDNPSCTKPNQQVRSS